MSNIDAAVVLAQLIEGVAGPRDECVTVSDVGAVADSASGGLTITMPDGQQFDVRVREKR